MQQFCKREIYYCEYEILDYHSNVLSSVNMLQERKLCSRRCTSEMFLFVYRVYNVSIDNILIWICEVYYTI
jgi:hypothetical protein